MSGLVAERPDNIVPVKPVFNLLQAQRLILSLKDAIDRKFMRTFQVAGEAEEKE
jgi:hypothetical protein